MGSNILDSLPQCNIIIHDDVSDADNLNEMICPICRCPLKLYQIHYDEKFLMCGNILCSYPFGVEDYHIYKIECNEEFVRNECSSSMMSATSGSTISYSDWSEMDRMMQNSDHFNSSISPPPSLIEKPAEIQKIQEVKKSVQNEAMIRRNVRKIKELHKQLYQFDEMDCISNDKWIKEIAQMQERSGVQVLKEHELKKFKEISDDRFRDLKLNINSTESGISVKVDVAQDDKDKHSKNIKKEIKDKEKQKGDKA